VKLYSALLASLLAAAIPGAASAEKAAPATPAAPAARLQAVLAPTGQALLFDQNRGEYVVVRSGDTFQGFRVGAIGADQVVLSTPGPAPHHFVLQRADATPSAAPPTAVKVTELDAGDDAPIDPYDQPGLPPPAAATPPAPIDPYAGTPASEPAPAEAPIDPFAAEPASEPAPAKAPIDPFGGKWKPSPVHNSTPAAPAGKAPIDPFAGATGSTRQVTGQRVVLRRAELDDALADFTVLASEAQIRVEGKRVRIAELSRGSFFHRLGLRKGDLVVSVAGDPVYDVDRAAAVYAKLKRADQFTIKLYRGTQRMKIAVELKR
jgi:hypothetical protein